MVTGDGAWVPILVLWCALSIDRLLGEPPARLHPVVWMGRYLSWAGRRIAPADHAPHGGPATRFLAGALAWAAGACIVLWVAWAGQRLLEPLTPWIAVPLAGTLLKPMLAWRMLASEVQAVEQGLAVSLDVGRERLGRLVSRDVSGLDEHGVRESAIESLAENLSDSVVAPLFWFVLAGLPGAALYRFANTADAMWGYRGARGGRNWEWAGKFAARADDVLSWVPARVTALLLALADRRWIIGLHSQARRTPSPNGGWPMAAMAMLLGVRLGKPGVYLLNESGRLPAKADTTRALRLAGVAVVLSALAGSLALWASDATTDAAMTLPMPR
nr:adenosylcobinamide-phosphate synthase CbiB [Variovorax dokdonensis]